MPSIVTSKNGGVIRWDQADWLAGLIPQYTSIGNTGTMSSLNGFTDTRAIDPYRVIGYLNPGGKPTEATNNSVVDTILKNGVANGTLSYVIGGTKVHEFNPGTHTLTNAGAWPHTISAHGGHSSVVGQDVIIYNPSGTPYLFYSWNDNTDGDVGRYDLASTFDDDFMSTVPTAAAALSTTNPHPMIIGDDNLLYIANGKDLASYDGATFNASALDLPSGFIIHAFTKTQNFLVVFASKNVQTTASYRSESVAFFWDYYSTSFTYAYPISGNVITAGFNFMGVPGCFTQGRSVLNNEERSSKLHLFDGSVFKTIKTFTETAPGFGGVEVIGDVIRWISDGNIFQYGSAFETPITLNKIAKGAGTGNGMLKNLYANEFYASTGTTSSGGLDRVSAGFASNALANFPVVDFSYPEDYRIQFKYFKIYWKEIVATASTTNTITILLRFNNGQDNHTIVNQLAAVTKANLIQVFFQDVSGNVFPVSNSVQLLVQYGSGDNTSNEPPIIRAVEAFFDFIK